MWFYREKHGACSPLNAGTYPHFDRLRSCASPYRACSFTAKTQRGPMLIPAEPDSHRPYKACERLPRWFNRDWGRACQRRTSDLGFTYCISAHAGEKWKCAHFEQRARPMRLVETTLAVLLLCRAGCHPRGRRP